MEHIRMERDGAVGTITIDRPGRFNSMDVRTAQDFRRAGRQYAHDEAIRVVVLRGLPQMFCSGADLKFVHGGGDAKDLACLAPGSTRGGYGETFTQILEYIHSAISEIRRAPKPFVAAVDGAAAAGGFGIAMSCDLVFASTRASFEWAYSKTGLTGAESTTFMLPRLIGLRRAMELMLMNPRLGPSQALDYGLINGVYDVDRFDDAVGEIARQIADGPTRAFAVAKELLNQGAGIDRLDDHLDRELTELSRSADGPEFERGLAAFFAKRPARFQEVP